MANYSPKPELGTLRVPLDYPTEPTPGKIDILWDANKREIYHKLSPYGNETFFGIRSRQPYFYTYPDESSESDQLEIVDIFQHAVKDVERVSKFMISGQGLLWIGKQFLLQTGNAFNETRIWNPTSPILGAALPLSFWAIRPQRNIDTSNLLGSLLGSVGTSIGSIFSTAPTPPPAGTAGAEALPTPSIAGGKGLLRGGTANKAKTVLINTWSPPSTAGLGLGGWISNSIKTLFGNFIPQRQGGVERRSDEITYGLMLGSYGGEFGPFSYQGVSRFFSGPQQYWYGGGRTMRETGQSPLNEWWLLYVDEYGKPIMRKPFEAKIPGLTGYVGYPPADGVSGGGGGLLSFLSSRSGTPDGPIRYGDFVGNALPDDDWQNSNMLIQHSFYSDTARQYPSKRTYEYDPSVRSVNDSLQRVIRSIGESGVYKVNAKPDSSVLMGNQYQRGYDRIAYMKKHGDADVQYEYSVLKEYRNQRVLENQFTSDIVNKSFKTAGSKQFDGLNTLAVLDGDKSIKNFQLTNWTKWNPYQDDLIAFYFYDVVNKRYVPFRATIRGLQETDSVSWEELSFIGRADKLYSYGGFNRSLAFNFTVHISSVRELAPTWQRINYLMSLSKPSNYTSGGQLNPSKNLHTRFIVPPMVMLNIGDMYKNQPVVLSAIGLTVPDSATWETLNEYNSEEWAYLVDYIKSPDSLYAQLPKTVEISVTAYLLEKERAIAGAAHFGHAPHGEEYKETPYRKTAPDYAEPSDFHKALVVHQKEKGEYQGDIDTTSNQDLA